MEILLSVGAAQALFAALFLMTKPARSTNDIVLVWWMVFLALPLITGASVQLWPDVRIPLMRADLIYPLTYGPFMWLYVGALIGDISKIAPRHLAHFVPFVAMSLYQLISGWAPPPPNPAAQEFSTSIRLIGGLNLAVLLAYSAAVFWRLRRHERDIVEHFSDLPTRVRLGWLRWWTAGLTGVFLILFLAALLSLPALLGVHLAALVLSIFGLSYFGFRQNRVFVPRDKPAQARPAWPQAHTPASTPSRMKPRYDRSGLTPERAKVIASRLEKFMRDERPYLDPDLTIEALAKRIAVPRHHLTEVISNLHQKNFYLFVNQFRIEAVQQAMKNPSQADQTLLEIAYASGFNSKSPFNAAFKKLTGKTPSQYRRELH